MAPKSFGEKEIGEVPATDVKLLVGKKVEVALPEVLGQTPKFYMKMVFKISRVEGNKAFTDFDGCEAAKEQIGRIVRKRLGKVESVNDIITKDNHRLHVKSIYILNRKTNRSVQTKVRALVGNIMEDYGKTATLDDFIKGVSAGVVQHKIKKQLNKVYPVRVAEIARVRTMK